MKQCIAVWVTLLSISFASTAQERLMPLTTNPILVQQYGAATHSAARERFISRHLHYIEPDTLSLPFEDDFSTDKRAAYYILDQIADDTFFASGPCLLNEDVTLRATGFMRDTAYRYSYDVVSERIDSTPIPQVVVSYFAEGDNCLDTKVDVNYWPSYYHKYVFNTDGQAIDSVLVEADTVIDVVEMKGVKLTQDFNWIDDHAYLNNTYPFNALSIGVATFDGIDGKGQPYTPGNPSAYGQADFLTSQPLNLQGLSEANNVYLSFVYQAKGLGDLPDARDSLIVEFLDQASGNWKQVWAIPGFAPTATPADTFTPVFIQLKNITSVTDPIVFYNGFQFRFVNKANTAGNNDHWHIDYVRLDQNRTEGEPINDITIGSAELNFLERYTTMPYTHFEAAQDLRSDLELTVRNLAGDAAVTQVSWNLNVTELATPTTVFDNGVTQFGGVSEVDLNVRPANDYAMPALPGKKGLIESEFGIDISDAARNTFRQNDTLRHQVRFGTALAYDDGSAERAYGLEGVGLKKFALRYDLDQADTLSAIAVHFANVDQDVSNLVFSLNVWQDFETGVVDGQETVLASIDNRTPDYVDSINGYAVFTLSEYLEVNGTFYIGWSQVDERNLNIGYDLNSTRGRPHMYVYRDAVWEESSVSIDGSPMIRAILDGQLELNPISSVSARPLTSSAAIIYPNPATDYIHIGNGLNYSHYRISNLLGQQMQDGPIRDAQIDIQGLAEGMYLVELIGVDGERVTKRLYKR